MYNVQLYIFFFFFKQKTAYELRISDWSSDVCSSDLPGAGGSHPHPCRQPQQPHGRGCGDGQGHCEAAAPKSADRVQTEIGSASCRERVCQSVEISGVAVSLKKKKNIIHILDVIVLTIM